MKCSGGAVLMAVGAALTLAQGLPTQKVLTTEVANTIAQEAIAKCRADGYRVRVAVLDRENALKVLVCDGSSGKLSIDVAHGQTLASLAFGTSSAEAGKILASIPNPPQIPGVMAIGGALPVKVGQDAMGAVGASGAPGGEKDEACAATGLAKVADKLK